MTDCHGSDPTRAFELVALEPRPVARQGARDNAGHAGQPVLGARVAARRRQRQHGQFGPRYGDQVSVPLGDFPGGKVTALRSVSLGGGILESAWYQLTMDVVVRGDDLSVTGRAFRHMIPDDPDSAVGTRVGGTLSTPTPLNLTALGLQGSGEVGIVASAMNAVVDSSVTNFAIILE